MITMSLCASSMSRMSSSLVASSLAAAAAVIGLAATAPAGEFAFSTTDSAVAGLASMADLAPLAEIAAIQASQGSIVSVAAAPTAGSSSGIRSSAMLSSEAFTASNVFANSKNVMPLLVSDLEPASSVSLYRPSTARAVGAPPSLPLSSRPIATRRGPAGVR